MRKTVPFVTLLFLVGIVAANGCSPVATPPSTATPVPTPDIAATVEAAIAAALASQPAPDATATYAAIATEIAVTQLAKVEPAVTPTPVPPTATPAAITQAEPACVSPLIEFTHVPPYGNRYEDLQGRVACVKPADYKVAVYIYVSGWFNKPYLASPLTIIQSDGAWTTDITLAEYDPLATQIAAFLIPNGYSPPLMEGEKMFPEELSENSVAYAMEDRKSGSRTIEFSGYT